MIENGYLLASRDEADKSLWFVFHADESGALAYDLATVHPRVSYHRFESAMDFEDTKPTMERVVLLGGPDRSDDALIILHETKDAVEDSHRVNDHFSFLPYSFAARPGRAPVILNRDDKPSRISLKPDANFLVIMGYRMFGRAELEDMACLPATNDVVFGSMRAERKKKAFRQIN